MRLRTREQVGLLALLLVAGAGRALAAARKLTLQPLVTPADIAAGRAGAGGTPGETAPASRPPRPPPAAQPPGPPATQPPAQDWPPVGRFDSKGRYRPPPRRRRFDQLHRRRRVPHLPVVLVHGIVGFDRIKVGPVYGDYWVGVKRMLDRLGVEYFAPFTKQFGGIEERARDIDEQLSAEMQRRGWTKVNLVGHSMAGLDMRYLVTHLGWHDRVASVTSVSSPHRGSWYADFATKWVFEKQKFLPIWRKLGLAYDAIPEVSVRYCTQVFNPSTPDMPGVRYFSISGHKKAYRTLPGFSTGTLVIRLFEKMATGQKLNFFERQAARLVMPKRLRRGMQEDPAGTLRRLGVDPPDWVQPGLEGYNDALISVSSAMWGEHLGTVYADHLDQIGWFPGGFDNKRFFRGILEMLSDAGY